MYALNGFIIITFYGLIDYIYLESLEGITMNEEFADSISKNPNPQDLMDRLIAGVSRLRGGYLSRIGVKSGELIELVCVSQIHCIEGEGRYARLHLGDCTRFTDYSLKELEKKLHPTRFLRVHKSWIVAADKVTHIKNLNSGDSILILENGTGVRLSRRYRKQIIHLVEQMNDFFYSARLDSIINS